MCTHIKQMARFKRDRCGCIAWCHLALWRASIALRAAVCFVCSNNLNAPSEHESPLPHLLDVLAALLAQLLQRVENERCAVVLSAQNGVVEHALQPLERERRERVLVRHVGDELAAQTRVDGLERLDLLVERVRQLRVLAVGLATQVARGRARCGNGARAAHQRQQQSPRRRRQHGGRGGRGRHGWRGTRGDSNWNENSREQRWRQWQAETRR